MRFSMGYKIIGMNGMPVVQCGGSMVVVERSDDGMISIFHPGSDPSAWYHRDEVGTWTEFETPVEMQADWLNKEIRALYMDTKDLDLPMVREHDSWVRTKEYEDIYVLCGTEGYICSIRNSMATKVMENLRKTLSEMHEIADVGLCLVEDKEVRLEFYLYYCSTMALPKAKQIFDTFVAVQYPELTWDDFLERTSCVLRT